jgi:hypothetical protein
MRWREIEGLVGAIEWIAAILLIQLVIYAVTMKPPWLMIGKTALFMAFGLVATFGFFVFAAYVHDIGFSAIVFVLILICSYVVADKLDQI